MGLRKREVDLVREPDALERLARALASGVSAALLAALVEARRRDAQGGWIFLSELATRVGESPGAVSAGLSKLAPFLEEKREGRRRYFRSRVRALSVRLEVEDAAEKPDF